MGWGTNFYVCHYFSRKTYDHKWQVEEDLEDAKRSREDAEKRLTQLAFITDPSKFMSKEDIEEGIDATDWLNFKLRDLFEQYRDAEYDVVWLSELLQSWNDCHDKDGLAIPNPDEHAWSKAYLDGDFVRTVENPDLKEKVEEQSEIELSGELFTPDGEAKK